MTFSLLIIKLSKLLKRKNPNNKKKYKRCKPILFNYFSLLNSGFGNLIRSLKVVRRQTFKIVFIIIYTP
jgi:hypothetical protein